MFHKILALVALCKFRRESREGRCMHGEFRKEGSHRIMHHESLFPNIHLHITDIEHVASS